jgi:uncharacterized peroxidase-related enzyme
MGLTDEEQADEFVAQVATYWRKAPLDAADYALCAFAEKLSLYPAEMSAEDNNQLRSHGFDDRAIHDATQVIAYFNYINRIADGLDVALEEFIRPWEQMGEPG